MYSRPKEIAPKLQSAAPAWPALTRGIVEVENARSYWRRLADQPAAHPPARGEWHGSHLLPGTSGFPEHDEEPLQAFREIRMRRFVIPLAGLWLFSPAAAQLPGLIRPNVSGRSVRAGHYPRPDAGFHQSR